MTAPKEFITSFITEGRYYFLLDEFHYVRDGGQKLKLLYDTLKNVKFVITGSSSLELRAETAAYLTGRMFSFDLLPFNFYEFLNARDKRFARIYKEVVRILDILQQTYVIDLIRPYHRNQVTELRKNPKVYFVDSGLRNYLINNFSALDIRVDKDALAENFVLDRLKYIVGDTGIIHFWRTTAKAEVDFVIEMPDNLIPVEVKFKPFVKEKVPKGLISFIKTYSPALAVVVTKNFVGEKEVDETMVKFIPIVYF